MHDDIRMIITIMMMMIIIIIVIIIFIITFITHRSETGVCMQRADKRKKKETRLSLP